MKVRRSVAALLVLVLLLGVLAPTVLAATFDNLGLMIRGVDVVDESITMTYGESAMATVTGVPEGVEASCKYEITDASQEGVANITSKGKLQITGIGTFKIKVTVTAESYDDGIITSKVITADRRDLTGATVTLDNNSFEYTGSEFAPKIQSVVFDDVVLTAADYDVTAEGASGTEIGDYTLKITFKGNYTGTASATWSITKPQDHTVLPAAKKDLTYNGYSQKLLTPGEAEKPITYSRNATGPFTADIPEAKNAGDYTVYYKIGDDEAVAVEVTIDKAKLYVTADDKRVYCGDRAPEYTATITGFQGHDVWWRELEGEVYFNCDYTRHSKPGNYTITPYGTLKADNYEIFYRNGTLKAVVWEYYDIDVVQTGDGTVKVDRSYAAPGKTVTVTVTPDWGGELRSLTVTDSRGNDVKLTYHRYDDVYTFEMPYRNVTVKAVFAETDLPFVDVSDWDWYSGGIRYVYENGLMNGTSSWYFRPNANTTRAMVATVLYRLEGSPRVSGGSGFADVKSGSWYDDAVTWASRYGIIKGYGDDTFGPNDSVTREQMAAMLYRYADYCRCDMTAGRTIDLSQYRDHGDVSTYAIPALRWAIGEEIITGRTGRFLAPDGTASRAEVAVMVARFAEDVIG